jgi:hypothetical protein
MDNNKAPVPAAQLPSKSPVAVAAAKPSSASGPAPSTALKPVSGSAPGAAKPAGAPATAVRPVTAPAAATKPAPTAASPAQSANALQGEGGLVLEQPAHPFEEFLAKEFDRLVANMRREGARLKVHPLKQVSVLVQMMTIRVAAFGVLANIGRVDVLKVLDHFWALQPKPKPAPAPVAK